MSVKSVDEIVEEATKYKNVYFPKKTILSSICNVCFGIARQQTFTLEGDKTIHKEADQFPERQLINKYNSISDLLSKNELIWEIARQFRYLNIFNLPKSEKGKLKLEYVKINKNYMLEFSQDLLEEESRIIAREVVKENYYGNFSSGNFEVHWKCHSVLTKGKDNVRK